MIAGSARLKFCVCSLLLGACLINPIVSASVVGKEDDASSVSNPGSDQEKQTGPAAQRLRSELRLLLLDLIQSGAFGDVPADRISLDLVMAAEQVATLGVVVDSRNGAGAAAGLIVLGTTPGGLADTLGMRGGDVIVSLNDTSLVALGDDEGGSARAASVLRRQFASLADGAEIKFKLSRDGKDQVVAGKVHKSLIPAVHLRLGDPHPTRPSSAVDSSNRSLERCGHISVFDNAPPQRDLHPVKLISIDGKYSPADAQTSFRVSTGSHVVTVAENVDSRYLGFNSRLRDNQGPSRYKSLSIDVKADTTYRIATHMLPEHRNEWRDGAWWEPVVWSESSESCR